MNLAATLGTRFVLLLTGRCFLLMLGLVTTAVLTRSLGPEGFGYFRTAVAYLGLAMVISDFGLASVFVREISAAGADQPRIIGSMLTLRFAISTAVLGAAVGFAFLLDLERPAQLGVVAGSAGFVAYALHLMLFGLFQQKLRQHGAVLAEVGGGLVLLAAVVVMAVMGAEPALFVAALGASYVLTLVGSLVFARRLAGFRPRVDFGRWRALLRVALPLALTGTLSVLYVRADSVLIALLSTPEAVGLYGVPVKISDSMLGVSLLLIGLFAPLLARSAWSEPQRFSRYLEQGLAATLIVGAAAALALNALATEIVILLGGSAFAQATEILRILSLFVLGHSLTLMLREAAVALHVQHRLVRVYVAGAVTAFVCYVPLIARFGGAGAAATLVIAELVVLCLIFGVVRSASAQPVSLRVPALAALSGLAAACILTTVSWFGAAWWARLVLTFIAFLGMLIATGALAWPTVLALARSMLQRGGRHAP